MFKSKRFQSLMLASAILLGVATPAFADSAVHVSETNVQGTQQVVDVKTVVENGKVITTIKYSDGTESQVVTALPNITGGGNSTTEVKKPLDPQYEAPKSFADKLPTGDVKTALDSNDDKIRRDALQTLTGITINDADNYNPQTYVTTLVNGKETKTPVAEYMKDNNFYAVNANTQELVMHGVRSGDWQPYYQLQYQKTPLYFSLAEDGKLTYSKIYYANQLEQEVRRYRGDMSKFYQDDLSLTKDKATIVEEHKKNANALLAKWKEAKGPVTYIIGINSSDAYAVEWGVERVPTDYFNSVYNDPMVHREGKFSPGAATKTWY